MSRIPHFLDKRFMNGGKIVSLKRRQSFTPRKIFWCLFLLEAELNSRAMLRLEEL
jgi:hypothetical protein